MDNRELAQIHGELLADALTAFSRFCHSLYLTPMAMEKGVQCLVQSYLSGQGATVGALSVEIDAPTGWPPVYSIHIVTEEERHG